MGEPLAAQIMEGSPGKTIAQHEPLRAVLKGVVEEQRLGAGKRGVVIALLRLNRCREESAEARRAGAPRRQSSQHRVPGFRTADLSVRKTVQTQSPRRSVRGRTDPACERGETTAGGILFRCGQVP